MSDNYCGEEVTGLFNSSIARPDYYYKMWRIGGPMTCVVGIIGNIMTLVIVYRLRSKAPSYLFIMALAASDIVMNLTGLPPTIYAYTCKWVADLSVFTCKAVRWVIVSNRMTSACLTAAICVCRAVQVTRPHLSSLRSPRVIKAVIISIWVAVYVLNSFILHVRELYYVKGKWRCLYILGYRPGESSSIFSGYRIYMVWFDNLGSLILPFIAMGISGIILVREVFKSTRQVAAVGQQENSYTRMTVLVLAISVFFFVFNFPAFFCQSIVYFVDDIFDKEGRYIFTGVFEIAKFISYTNSATDLFMYVLTSRDIRKKIKEMMLIFVFKTILLLSSTTYGNRSSTNIQSRKTDHSISKRSENFQPTRISLAAPPGGGNEEKGAADASDV